MKPPPAPVTLPIGPDPLGPAFTRSVRLSLTGYQALKAGLGPQWALALANQQARQSRNAARRAARLNARSQMKSSVARLLAFARAEHWSARELARRAGLSWGAFRRCRDGQCNPTLWLPKIQTALARLTHSSHA